MSTLPTTAILPSAPPNGLAREERMQLQIAERSPVAAVVNIMRRTINSDVALAEVMKAFQCDENGALLRMADPEVHQLLNAEIRLLRLSRGRRVERVAEIHAATAMENAFAALTEAMACEPSEETNERIKQLTVTIQALGYTADVSIPEPTQTAAQQQQQINIQVNSNSQQQATAPWKERSIRAREGLPQMSNDGVVIEGSSVDNK
jgi:hypothetical protein